jgi:hypothetical protein
MATPTEAEITEALQLRGWKKPADAVEAYWSEAARAKFDYSSGARLRWPVRDTLASGPYGGTGKTSPPSPLLYVEYWGETGTFYGRRAFRIVGQIAGAPGSLTEVQAPQDIS